MAARSEGCAVCKRGKTLFVYRNSVHNLCMYFCLCLLSTLYISMIVFRVPAVYALNIYGLFTYIFSLSSNPYHFSVSCVIYVFI